MKEQSIPKERNIAEADPAVIVTDDLVNQKKLNAGDPVAINPHVADIDHAVDLEIEIPKNQVNIAVNIEDIEPFDV